jgi:hypothetical protein
VGNWQHTGNPARNRYSTQLQLGKPALFVPERVAGHLRFAFLPIDRHFPPVVGLAVSYQPSAFSLETPYLAGYRS